MNPIRNTVLLGLLLSIVVGAGRLQGDEIPPANDDTAAANAADWFQWRGPRGDGVSGETGWSTDWPAAGPEVLWRVNVGVAVNNKDGSSAVSVAGGRAYAMGTGHVYCLEAETGDVVWKVPFPASHSTPAVQDGRVYVYSTQGKFVCLNAATGQVRWSKDMQRGLGATRAGAYGYACSPMLTNDMVLITARISGGALVAFDKQTGEVEWTAFHPGHRGYALWSSPVPATINGQACVVWLSGPSVVGLNPADGKTLWKFDIPEENGKVGCAPATPIVAGNRVIAQYHPPHARGYTFCLEIKGDQAQVAWRSRDLANWYFSCVAYDGCLYGVDQSPRGRPRDMGALQCYDIATGKLLWSINGFGQDGTRPVRQTRTLVPKGCFMIADGKMISWASELVVAEISAAGHKLLSAAKLPLSGYRTMPVLSGGRIYLRARDGHLVCLNMRKNR